MRIKPININQYNDNDVKFKSKKITDSNIFVKLYEHQKLKNLAAKLAEDKFIARLSPEQKRLKDLINKKNITFKELNGANINRAVHRATPVITSDLDEFIGDFLKNKKAVSAYKKFAKIYSEQKQNDIPQAFSSCLNGDGTLSKYALRTLNALYKSQYPSFLKNLKYKLLRKNMHGCDPRDSAWGTKFTKIADIINACKDSQNNSNKQNLKFAQQIFIDTPTSRKDIPEIINASKNEEGICTKENIEFYMYLYKLFPQNFSQLLAVMPDKNGVISPSVKNFQTICRIRL